MEKRVIISGFGGQGVLSLGIILSTLALSKSLHTSWIPSYGAEMRGGTANCSVVYSTNLIGSPIVNDEADLLICMNNPSLQKFEDKVKPGGTIILNTSVVTIDVRRTDIDIIKVNATDIASDIGSPKIANMVILSHIVKESKEFNVKDAEDVIKEKFAHKVKLIPLNIKAINTA